jgi:pimeloyl-ACP methyl ester carboxylesterase
MHLSRRSLALCALLLAAIAAPSAGAAEPRTPEGVPVPSLDWRPCDGGFECATAEVPQDYAKPHGATVRLAVIRRRALDQEHRIGSIFLDPGGPSGSGVEFVESAPPPVFQILSKFDVVGFDRRGVGRSEPSIQCEEPPAFTAMTPDTLDLHTLLSRGRALARLCLNRDPRFLAGANTGNGARDLDLLRAAVGDDKLTYYGLSYGGQLGATYASLFPGRARALALDSPIDANVGLNDPLRAAGERLAGLESSLQRFFTACAAHQDACGFGADDPEEAYDELLARLDASPLDLGDGRRLRGDDLRDATVGPLASKRSWPLLAAILRAAAAEDAPTLRELVPDTPFNGVVRTYRSVEGRYPRHALAPYLAEAERAFSASPHYAAGSYEEVAQLFWPIRPRGAYYGPFRHAPGATPALVIAGTHDPLAPYAWGKRVVRDLGNARLLTYRGDGHGVIVAFDPCALAAFLPYVEEGKLPPPGASCKQNIPFGAAALRSRRPEWGNPVSQ